MPHATCRYQFEWKVFRWAKDFSAIFTGYEHNAFFVVFAEGGCTRKVIFGDQPEMFDRGELEVLQQESSSWLFHDPFEGPVYTYVQWRNVDRRTMERITGAVFEPEDFVSDDTFIEFPTSWGVLC